jgi:hypothetical protein
MTTDRERPGSLIIRPPSEWRGALVRLTRGCHQNGCRFCGTCPRGAHLFYPHGSGGEERRRHAPSAVLQSRDSFSRRLGPSASRPGGIHRDRTLSPGPIPRNHPIDVLCAGIHALEGKGAGNQAFDRSGAEPGTDPLGIRRFQHSQIRQQGANAEDPFHRGPIAQRSRCELFFF